MASALFCTLAVTAASCRSSEGGDPTDNSVTVFEGSLDILKGPEGEAQQVREFPFSDYKVYTVRGLGSFYVDKINDLIKRDIKRGLPWEKDYIEIMKLRITPGSTAVDVGAHIGTHTLTMSKFAGEQGRVVAFEPQIKLYSELVHNVLLNKRDNVTAYRCALGDECRAIEMNPAFAENEGATGIGEGGDPAMMITLDSLGLDNVSFIKIDVENSEYGVLLGARETIRRNRPYMIIEIMGNSYLPVSNRTEMVEKTTKLVEDMGYSIHFIENSWSDWLATPN